MKKIVLISTVLLFNSCFILIDKYTENHRPKKYTFHYTGNHIGLDSLIKINGYYASESVEAHYNDYTYMSRIFFILYEDGLCASVRGDEESILSLLKTNSKEKDKFEWGCFVIDKDTIKMQTVMNKIGPSVPLNIWEYQFVIKSQTELELIYKKYLNTGKEDSKEEGTHFLFYPCENKIDSTSWLLNKKWFWDEDAYKMYK